MREIDFNNASVRELLATYAKVMDQLRKREVVQTSNNPVADYSEYLVARALKLEPQARSNKGCDAIDKSSGKRYEIKGRRVTSENRSRQLSVIRELDSCQFDFLVGVLFNENFEVTSAHSIPYEVVKGAAGERRAYVNGWIIHLRPSLLERPGVKNITPELRKAQGKWV
jgi:hypothetical protein